MKISYDPEVDALYIEFHPLAPGTADCRPLTDEIIANYGPDGMLAGLEVIAASKVMPANEHRMVFEIASPVMAS